MDNKLVIAQWNLKVGRDHRVVTDFITRKTRRHDVDVWVLQECVGYQAALRAVPDMQVFQRSGRPHSDNCAILVRDGIETGRSQVMRMHQAWPRPKLPGIHPPRTWIQVEEVAGWLDVTSVHVVSVRGRPEGIADRRKAREESARLMVAESSAADLAHASAPLNGGPRRGQLWAGDFNDRPGESGKFHPRWIARKAGMRIINTGRIDFPMVSGVKVSNVRVCQNTGGSDHHPVVYTVQPAAA